MLAISHMGNWELYAQAAFQRPETRFGTVYQALRNRHLDELINRRPPQGGQTFDRKEGFQAAIALLRRPGSTAVLVDQSAGHGGIWMPFFNRLCSNSPLAAALAIRTNSAVVPAAIFTSGFARWRIVFEEEIPYDRKNPEQLDGGYQRRSRTADPPIARGLVLGSQPLEDAVAEPSHCQTKARDLSASWLRPHKALSLSLRRALAQLARRRGHEPPRRAGVSPRTSGRPAFHPDPGETRRLLENDCRSRRSDPLRARRIDLRHRQKDTRTF